MNDATKTKVLARIHRIAGQLEGVSRMIERDRALVDVLLQLASAHAALGQAGKVILRACLERGVTAAIATDAPAERKQNLRSNPTPLRHVWPGATKKGENRRDHPARFTWRAATARVSFFVAGAANVDEALGASTDRAAFPTRVAVRALHRGSSECGPLPRP